MPHDADAFAALFARPEPDPAWELAACCSCGQPTPACELAAFGKCENCFALGCPQIHNGLRRVERADR
jgi:hypothetical protein